MPIAREQQIINDLQTIIDRFISTDDKPTLSMFSLISQYNATGQNVELIGGEWAIEHGFDLK